MASHMAVWEDKRIDRMLDANDCLFFWRSWFVWYHLHFLNMNIFMDLVSKFSSFLSEPDVNKLNNELQLLELSKTKRGVQNVFISTQSDPKNSKVFSDSWCL